MTVPEAAVNEDDSAMSFENDVRIARQRSLMNAKPKSQPVERSSHKQLGAGISAPNTPHNVAALFGRPRVHTGGLVAIGYPRPCASRTFTRCPCKGSLYVLI